MVSATVLFQPGWIHVHAGELTEDPTTGEPIRGEKTVTPGRGLVQQHLWNALTEVSATAVVDERLVLFEPETGLVGYEVDLEDYFFSPEGQCWQAKAEGLPRGIPGLPPEYIATLVRRAKEKDHVRKPE